MRVHVYRNLRHQDQLAWSVVANEGPTRGRVLEVVSAVLVKDATFVVREGGRQRVLREQSKNVHAFIRGQMVRSAPLGCESKLASPGAMLPRRKGLVRVSYDPYLYEHFYVVGSGEPIASASLVAATADGVFVVGKN